MTKIILLGGGDIVGNKKRYFFNEILEGLSKKKGMILVLVVPFARYKDDWGKIFKKYSKKYNGLKIKKSFILASPNKEVFKKQVKKSNLIFLCGGGEEPLMEYLKDVKLEDLNNKVVVGVSAGANVFSKYYYSNDRNKIGRGLGLLPIKTICHYNNKRLGRLKKLVKYGNKYISYAIKEGDYIKIEV
jgi:peptidase E